MLAISYWFLPGFRVVLFAYAVPCKHRARENCVRGTIYRHMTGRIQHQHESEYAKRGSSLGDRRWHLLAPPLHFSDIHVSVIGCGFPVLTRLDDIC